MNRFFLITLQWPTSGGRIIRTISGDVHDSNDRDAFTNIMAAANNQGIPTDANVIAFHLETAK